MGLSNKARMNFPGKVGGCWRWRYLPHMFSQDIAIRLLDMTELYGRSRSVMKVIE